MLIGRSDVDVSEGSATDPGHTNTMAMHIAQDCYAHKVEIDSLIPLQGYVILQS